MKIEFERSGGFAGMLVTTTVNTAILPEEDAQDLHDMVDRVKFFELPAHLESPVPGMDQFQYRLTMTPEEGQPHTVELSDGAATPDMQVLLRKLTLMARSQD